ncbi:MAG: hypothetical protein GXO44_00020 [Deferribacteres bacterium]|nr:hypothetical protein [Deferribacteres bacterium]
MKRMAIAVMSALLIVSCSTLKTQEKTAPPAQTTIQKIERIMNNIPVYPNLHYDTQNSFVYESIAVNAAIIVLKGKAKLNDVVSFYKENMPKYGWQLLSMFVHDNHATMVFDSMESSCTIDIKQESFNNIVVTIKTGTKAPVAK